MSVPRCCGALSDAYLHQSDGKRHNRRADKDVLTVQASPDDQTDNEGSKELVEEHLTVRASRRREQGDGAGGARGGENLSRESASAHSGFNGVQGRFVTSIRAERSNEASDCERRRG